jgi:hypothetical protein
VLEKSEKIRIVFFEKKTISEFEPGHMSREIALTIKTS